MTGDLATRVVDLKARIERLNGARHWHRWHDPKSVAVSILIEAGELAEHFQWSQKNDVQKFPKKKWKAVEEELADVLIYRLIFANRTGIDVSRAILKKIEKNERRFPARRWQKVKFS